jgi:Tol biopolymer transport system component
MSASVLRPSRTSTRRALLLALLGAVVAAIACGATPAGTSAPHAAETLAVVIDHSLYVQPVDGPRRILVTTPGIGVYPQSPRWSPDGRQIAYVQKHFFTGVAGSDWGDDVYVQDLAGGEPRLVRRHGAPGQQVEGLAWAADGRALLLGDVQVADSTSPLATASSRLIRYDLASGAETVVAPAALEPSISRDGQRIAYLQASGERLALMAAAADGSGAREIVPAEAFTVIRFPRIAPDGQSVIFAAPESVAAVPARPEALLARLATLLGAGHAEAHGLPAYVWSVDIATGTRRRLTTTADDDPCPAWIGGGEGIVIVSSTGLYRLSPSDGAIQRLEEGALGGRVDGR